MSAVQTEILDKIASMTVANSLAWVSKCGTSCASHTLSTYEFASNPAAVFSAADCFVEDPPADVR